MSRKTAVNRIANIHRREAMTNPAATSAVPKYSGFRTYAYGPLSASLMFFSRWPVAQARSSKPSAETGNPQINELKSGWENQAKAATSTKPVATRQRATRSAYGLGKTLIHV